MKNSRLRPYDIEESTYNEEWFQHYYTCRHCHACFMVDYGNPHFCPNCGHEIKDIKCGLVYTYDFKEETEHDS